MRAKILVTGVLVLALASLFVGLSAAGSDKSHFKATLSPYSEVPTNSTTGQGELEFVIDDAAQTITFTLKYTGLAAPALAAHIHLGARSTNGGVSVFFCGGAKPACPPGTSDEATVTGTIAATDVVGPAVQGIPAGPTGFPELVAAIRAGVTYANVHNSIFPGGEIRGQINDNDQRN
jgi:CHRD domain-containing protein